VEGDGDAERLLESVVMCQVSWCVVRYPSARVRPLIWQKVDEAVEKLTWDAASTL
jgi:hypothetical protein